MNRKAKWIVILLAMPILTLGFSLLAAKLILSELISQEALNVCVYAIAGLVSFLLSLYTALSMPQKKFFWSLLTAGIYSCALALGNLLFFGEGYGTAWPVLLSVLLGGTLGGVIGAGKRRKIA